MLVMMGLAIPIVDPQLLMQAIQSVLTDDLRRAPWKGDPNPFAGHCYVASESLYWLLTDRDAWVPCVIRFGGTTHWFLRNRADMSVLDPTAGQFQDPVPYAEGRGKGFLTKNPSKRAAEILRRLGSKALG